MRMLRFLRLFRVWGRFRDAFGLLRSPKVPLHLKLVAGALSLLAGWFVTAANRHAGAVTIEGELLPVDAGRPARV